MQRRILVATELLLLGCCWQPARCRRAAAPSPPEAADAATNCGMADFSLFTATAERVISMAMSAQPPPTEIRTRHAIAVMPGEPFMAGSELAGRNFAVLPRTMKDKVSMTAFTKFVVIAHGEKATDPLGISLGDDVCGGAGFSDGDAVRFLRKTVSKHLGGAGLQMLNCRAEPGDCPQRISVTLEEQLPFLAAISNNNLRGNIVPIMMQTQSAELGVGVGDAVAMLVASGGVWQSERVLFVFPAELSAGLTEAQAKQCDVTTAEVVTQQSVPQIAKYLTDVWTGKKQGDCGKSSVPRSYASLLAAARAASILGLTQTRYEVSNRPIPEGLADAGQEAQVGVMGFAAILFWE